MSRFYKFVIAAFAAFFTVTVFAQEENPMHIIAIHQTSEGLFSWVNKGFLYWIEFEPEDGCYLYRSDTSETFVITKSRECASRMIQEQLSTRQEVESFLTNKVAYVLRSFFGGPKTHIIDKGYIDHRKSLPAGAWPSSVDLASVKHSLAVLEKHLCNPTPIIRRDIWSIRILVQTRSGSVEQWDVRGQVHPFHIDNLERLECEPPMSVIPLPEVR